MNKSRASAGRSPSPIRCVVCSWCDGPIAPSSRPTSEFCSKRCRQTAYRVRVYYVLPSPRSRGSVAPAAFAYADPPYPGLARRYYGKESSYAGEVDHRTLIASLMDGGFAGWALSTGAYALRDVLPLCPEGVRVCCWAKMNGAVPATKGLHNGWEPLIVWGGRQVAPGKRDYICTKPARGGGVLPGRKPLRFVCWAFECLGMMPGDTLADLFPGTGIFGRAWKELNRRPEQLNAYEDVWRPRAVAPRGASRAPAGTTAPAGDASPGAGDVAEVLCDAGTRRDRFRGDGQLSLIPGAP